VTFLELCQRVRSECGIPGTGPAAVTGQSGEALKIVNWTADAYNRICAMHDGKWRFLRSTAYVNTTADDEDYAPTEFTDSVIGQAIGHATVGDFGSWMAHDPDTDDSTFRIYLVSAGSSTQQIIRFIPYGWFRDRYQLQAPDSAFPAELAIRPRDSAILCGNKPNGIYRITGDYYRVAPPLAADNDEPLFPAKFHMAIVWLAKQLYAGNQEDGGAYVEANNNYKAILGRLEMDQLPKIGLGAPLA